MVDLIKKYLQTIKEASEILRPGEFTELTVLASKVILSTTKSLVQNENVLATIICSHDAMHVRFKGDRKSLSEALDANIWETFTL